MKFNDVLKYTLILSTALFLGCTSSIQHKLNQANVNITNAVGERCFANGPGTYKQWAQCRSDIFVEFMPQAYPFWPLLNHYLLSTIEATNYGDAVQLSQPEMAHKLDRLWIDFTHEEQRLIRADQARRQVAAQHMAQALNNASSVAIQASRDLSYSEYAWDQFYGSANQLWWRCRSKSSGQFVNDQKCGYQMKIDNTWPGH